MTAAFKNIMIGMFVIMAFAIGMFILLFLHPSVGDNGKVLHVRFTDIDKVTVGTRVTYAGRPVGEVVSIKEIPEARNQRLDRNGHIYVYELTLKVDSGVNVFNTDEISVKTSGLLGERNVEITPLPLKPHETLYLINNEVIYATPSTTVEDTLKQIGGISEKFGVVLNHVNDILDQVKQEQIVLNFSRTAQNVAEITDALNQPDRWQEIIENITTLTERANHSWTTVDTSLQNVYSLTERAHRSWTTLDHSLENLERLSNRANNSWTTVDDALIQFRSAGMNTNDFTDRIKLVVQDTSRGKGTIGKLFASDDLYLRIKSVIHKVQTIADDASRFGLLFHLNKDWQRLNARRLRLLQRLSTPNQFTTYFNQEVEEINASLMRVSMVLNDTASYPQSLLCDPNFTTRFADLLRKVEGMEDSLKMYNEQVVDQAPECP